MAEFCLALFLAQRMLWMGGNVGEGMKGGRVGDKLGHKRFEKLICLLQACGEITTQRNAYLCLLLNVKRISIFQPGSIIGKRSGALRLTQTANNLGCSV